MIIIEWINLINIKCWQIYWYNSNIEVDPTCTSVPNSEILKTNWEYTCFYERVRVKVRARKCRHWCTNRAHLNCCIITVSLPTFDTWFFNSINYNHLAHIYVVYTARLSRLLRSKRQRGRLKQTVYRSFHMLSAVTWTSALATGTNRAVFSTSKVLPRRAVYKT